MTPSMPQIRPAFCCFEKHCWAGLPCLIAIHSGRYPLTVPAPIDAFTEAAGIGFDGDQSWDIEARAGRLVADLMRLIDYES